jgi:hypothetical protein
MSGLKGRTLNILLHYSTLLFFLCQRFEFEIPGHTSFIVMPARLVPASLTRVLPSELDAWPKAVSGQHHWLLGIEAGWLAAGPLICLSGGRLVLAKRDTISS